MKSLTKSFLNVLAGIFIFSFSLTLIIVLENFRSELKDILIDDLFILMIIPYIIMSIAAYFFMKGFLILFSPKENDN